MSNSHEMSRRNLLRTALLGPGYLGLRALATGLPAGVFGAMGLAALDARAASPRAPQYLLLLTSQDGEALNCNAPGTYGIDGIDHNPDPAMAETPVSFGDIITTAAAPWAGLPQSMRDRTAVLHHRTYQNAHPQYQKVLGLVGSARMPDGTGTEHLPSLIASELCDGLGTVQRAPIRVDGKGSLVFEGRPIQGILPSTLADLFAVPEAGDALRLADLRDQALDDIYRIAKDHGTPSQRDLIDRFVLSHDQVRSLDQTLVGQLAAITDDSRRSQLQAALTLFLMNLTPVVALTLEFSGDNHSDSNLTDERDETVASMTLLAEFFTDLEASPLRDRLVVANLDVFGRTLVRNSSGGRDHNLNHHTMMICGSVVQPGVFGGVAPSGNDFGATSIDSVTGATSDNADIPVDETLEAAAKTLCAVCGVPNATIDQRIVGGKVIEAIIER
ncbi:MAG: DUF1501 domain-containing protein [Myxococcota bacterium]